MKPIKARAGTPLPRWTQVLAPGCCSPGPKNRKSRTKLPHNSKSYPDSVFCGSSIGLEAHDRAMPKQILKEPPDPILQSLVQLRIQNEWLNLSMIFTTSQGGLPTQQSITKFWSCKRHIILFTLTRQILPCPYIPCHSRPLGSSPPGALLQRSGRASFL